MTRILIDIKDGSFTFTPCTFGVPFTFVHFSLGLNCILLHTSQSFIPFFCRKTSFTSSVYLRRSVHIRSLQPTQNALGLFAVHNLYTPFLFSLRKTVLRQVVHRDVSRLTNIRRRTCQSPQKKAGWYSIRTVITLS